jgi:hypothetical protein
LTKDFGIQYSIKKDGSLLGTYSYRVLNSTTLNTINQISQQYVNGLGLVYRRDFDTFGEFFRNIFRKKTPSKPKGVKPDTTAVIDEKNDEQ